VDADLNLIRTFAKICIGRILTEEPFTSMSSEDELNTCPEKANKENGTIWRQMDAHS
jgi:hypothetical protein